MILGSILSIKSIFEKKKKVFDKIYKILKKKKIKITYSVEKSLNVLKTLEDKSFSLKTL